MVNSGKVTGDLNTLTTYLTNYSSHVGDLAGNWKGPSYDNLSSKAEEFVSEYTSALNDGMTAFANACAKYEEYISTKRAWETACANRDAADDPAEKAEWAAEAERLAQLMQTLKAEIEAFLTTAASVSLTANSVSIPTFSAVADAQKKN